MAESFITLMADLDDDSQKILLPVYGQDHQAALVRFLADKGDSNCRACLRIISRKLSTLRINRFLF